MGFWFEWLALVWLSSTAPATEIEHVRTACAVETDAVCPDSPARDPLAKFAIAPGGSDTRWQSWGPLTSALARVTTPGYQSSVTGMKVPYGEWQTQEVAQRMEMAPCAGPVASLVWDPALVDLAWLKVRLWQLPSLQPQRCAVAPGVCLTDC